MVNESLTCLTEYMHLELTDVDVPGDRSAGCAGIRVRSCGICGSDVHGIVRLPRAVEFHL